MKAINTTAHAAYATDALSSAAYALLGQTEQAAVEVAHAMPTAELVVDLAALTAFDVPAMDAPAFVADTESAAVMAAYVPVEIVGEPSLLAQASGGLGATRVGGGQGQVVERPQNQGNDDDRGGMWWLLGGLGLLAAAGGGGGGHTDVPPPNPEVRDPYSLLAADRDYSTPYILNQNETQHEIVNGADTNGDYTAAFKYNVLLPNVGTVEVGISYNTQTGVLTIYDGSADPYQVSYSDYQSIANVSVTSNFKEFVAWVFDSSNPDHYTGTVFDGFDAGTSTFSIMNGALTVVWLSMDSQAYNVNVFNQGIDITYNGNGYAFVVGAAEDIFTYNLDHFASTTVLENVGFDVNSYIIALGNQTIDPYSLSTLDPSKYYILLGGADQLNKYDADTNLDGTQVFAYHSGEFLEITVSGAITDPQKLIQA